MAQQELKPFRLADRLYAAEKRAMRLATHPQSPGETTTTPEEWLHIQELREARMELERYGEGIQVAVGLIRLGPDAPSVTRRQRELHDCEGMR